MSYAAIAYTIPQYENYPNWWVKAYAQGTTTPILMAIDSNATTTFAKLEINVDGFPVTAGSALIIPYIDGAYDLWLFPTEAEADANDTTNALQFADDITAPPVAGSGSSAIQELTTLTMQNNTNKSYEVGDVIQTAENTTGNSGGGTYDAVLTSGETPNGFNILISIADSLISFVLRLNNKLPTLSQLGIASNATDNAAIMQYAVDTFGGYLIDIDYTFDVSLVLPATGAKISNVGSRHTATWDGLDADWAIHPISDAGSYINNFDGWTLRASANTKRLMDARYVRFSRFDGFYMLDGLINCRHNSCWNNTWFKCRFIGLSKPTNSIGLHFEQDDAVTFNVSNTTLFESCLFSANDQGIRMEAGGDALEFKNCGIEANNVGLMFTGKGGSHSMNFHDNYFETNVLGNIQWNKTGAGSMYGVVFQDNYYGTTSTARAGIIEFIASNAGKHSITIKHSTFRSFQGAPSESVLMDINGATMSNIFIKWYDNNYTDTGITIFPFNKGDVDWRYLSSDVGCELDLTAPGTRTWTTDETLIVMVEDGTATLTGVFESSDNVFTGALNVTDAMPATLRPANFTQQICTGINGASAEATAVTCMINAGQLRTINITNDTVRVDMTWRISQNQLTTETSI